MFIAEDYQKFATTSQKRNSENLSIPENVIIVSVNMTGSEQIITEHEHDNTFLFIQIAIN